MGKSLNLRKKSIFWQSFLEFGRSDKKRLFLSFLGFNLSNILDLLGVAAVGVVSSIAINGITNNPYGDRVSKTLEFVGISQLNFKSQVVVLASIAVSLFITKSLVSLYLQRRLLYFLSNRAATTADFLVKNFFTSPIYFIQRQPIQASIFALTSGPTLVNLGIIARYLVMLSDIVFLLAVFFVLLLVNAYLTLVTVTIYVVVGYLIYRLTDTRIMELGKEISKHTIQARQQIVELSQSYREIFVRRRVDYYSNKIGLVQYDFARKSAELNFLSSISKYVFEIVLVMSIAFFIFFQLALQNATQTFAVTALFVAASARIMPAMMRIQQNRSAISASRAMAETVFNLMSELGKLKKFSSTYVGEVGRTSRFSAKIEVRDLSFAYPGQVSPTISNLSFTVKPGTTFGISGRSGTGKSTLLDLILGINEPTNGEVLISGKPPRITLDLWPFKISYLSQSTFFVPGSLRSNLTIGLDVDQISEKEIRSVSHLVGLEEVFKNPTDLLEVKILESAANLSGGQRQRLALGRAIIRKPSILVLDESTSSLDRDSEIDLLKRVRGYLPNSTIIMVSHRKAVLNLCHDILYLKK